jgi:quaternary ammonium compound-resistance protein SugE
MPWVILVLSGALEAVWATALARSDGLKKWRPTAVFLLAMTASMVGLGWAMQLIPTGTAYAVWVGIGAALTAVWAIVSGRERASVLRVVLIAGLVACVVGLKVLS